MTRRKILAEIRSQELEIYGGQIFFYCEFENNIPELISRPPRSHGVYADNDNPNLKDFLLFHY
jgi:hypothetical protein